VQTIDAMTNTAASWRIDAGGRRVVEESSVRSSFYAKVHHESNKGKRRRSHSGRTRQFRLISLFLPDCAPIRALGLLIIDCF